MGGEGGEEGDEREEEVGGGFLEPCAAPRERKPV